MMRYYYRNLAGLLFVVLTLIGGSGCTSKSDQQKWVISLKKEDKKPYGTYLAYNSLKQFFPESTIQDLSRKYTFSNLNDNMNYGTKGPNVMILVALNFQLSEGEWDHLRQFVRNGNEVVLFCSRMDTKIEADLNCIKTAGREEYRLSAQDTSENLNMLSLTGNDQKKYGYKGRYIGGSFGSFSETDDTASNEDETYYTLADTLGYANDKPNCIRFQMGRGHITLHAAPLALSNYFLLQDGNINYLAGIWSTLPRNIDHIYWADFYRRVGAASAKGLWQFPAPRKGMLLLLFLAIVYVLFMMKRRQRIVPIIPPLRNDSVSFVETVGRLYYNKGNNTNLAEKMIQQFLEWVRIHYFLNTNLLNDDFISHLAVKSGSTEAEAQGLVQMIIEVKHSGTKIDDAYLYQLYHTIQHFYKKHQQ